MRKKNMAIEESVFIQYKRGWSFPLYQGFCAVLALVGLNDRNERVFLLIIDGWGVG